jgi:hypothetical protein
MNYLEKEETLVHKLSMKKIQDELRDDEEEDGPFSQNEKLMRGLHLVFINELEGFEKKIKEKKSNQSINTSLENCMLLLNLMLRRNDDDEWIDIIQDEIDTIKMKLNKRRKIVIARLPLADDLLEMIGFQVKYI